MNYLLTGFFCLIQLIASAQSDSSMLRSKTWLETTTRNAIEKRNGNFKAAEGGYALYFLPADTVNVPYLVYVPKTYDPDKSYPLIVYLHGGVVNLDSFEYKDPEFAEEPVFAIADTYNVLVVFPYGRKDFGWVKQPKAFEHIIAIIDEVGQTYHVDKQKTYLGGMSNGGSAAFWFITNKPDRFAGFYAFSSLPESKMFTINFKNITADKPLYSIHTKDDPVYPYAEVRAVYEEYKDESPGWHFKTLRSGGHGFLYNDNDKAVRIIEDLFKELLKEQE